MSSAPVEFRKWCKRFTIDDARAGITPMRLNTGPSVNGHPPPNDLFCPPVDQYRFKEKVYLSGKPAAEWSPWITVPVALESVPEPDRGTSTPELPPAA